MTHEHVVRRKQGHAVEPDVGHGREAFQDERVLVARGGLTFHGGQARAEPLSSASKRRAGPSRLAPASRAAAAAVVGAVAVMKERPARSRPAGSAMAPGGVAHTCHAETADGA